MSKKQKTYTAEFKTKVVLELLAGDQTVSEIASKYSLISKSTPCVRLVVTPN